jgi:hypothetical protein
MPFYQTAKKRRYFYPSLFCCSNSIQLFDEAFIFKYYNANYSDSRMDEMHMPFAQIDMKRRIAYAPGTAVIFTDFNTLQETSCLLEGREWKCHRGIHPRTTGRPVPGRLP